MGEKTDVFSPLLSKLDQATQQAPVLPIDVTEPYDTRGRIQGEINNGFEDLIQIYKLITKYRERHHGVYPINTSELMRDALVNAKDYGFRSYTEISEILLNPDTVFLPETDPKVYVPYIVGNTRLDDTSFNSPKFHGARDALAYTSIYMQSNTRLLPSGRNALNPVGYYLVLWDDGQVEKIAYDQLLKVTANGKHFFTAFPGQAGVPYDALTYDEYWGLLGTMTKHTMVGPRGKPVPENEILPIPDNGGPEALVTLSRLLGTPIEREMMWKVLDSEKSDFTLHDMQSAAVELHTTLQVAHLTIDALRQRGAPAILQMRDPNRLIVLATIDEKNSIIYDGGVPHFVDINTLARRYTGEALVAGAVENSSQVRPQNPLREISVFSKEKEIAQSVTLTNGGNTQLEVSIERPVVGITTADLSTVTVAPGASTTLNIKIKWRAVLRGETQTDFITLKTNDPLMPRLQLAFKLKLVTSTS
jgi:hypothetical protein